MTKKEKIQTERVMYEVQKFCQVMTDYMQERREQLLTDFRASCEHDSFSVRTCLDGVRRSCCDNCDIQMDKVGKTYRVYHEE